jgi:hypothetical protein
MKVKFSIQKGKETFKEGMFSKKEVDMYDMTATFTPTEQEKKIYNDHPLFHNFIFMEYNEMDKTSEGIIFKDVSSIDKIKVITVTDIYTSPSYKFKAYSINRMTEIRGFIIEAGNRFAENIEVLENLEGSEEIEFKPKK